MTQKFYVSKDGIYKGSYDAGEKKNVSPPKKWGKVVEVPFAPPISAKQKWNFDKKEYDPLPPLSKSEQLAETEDCSVLARKLEEVIDNLTTGAPLSQQTKDWTAQRKGVRG